MQNILICVKKLIKNFKTKKAKEKVKWKQAPNKQKAKANNKYNQTVVFSNG